MINFEIDGVKFNYRVAAIILNDEKNKILLNQNLAETFWFIPGGRCEPLEFSKNTLEREVEEEMGEDITIERPVFLVENLFVHADKKYHEIGIYYIAHIEGTNMAVRDEEFIREDELGKKIKFKWFNLDELKNISLQPAFLKERLQNIPDQMEIIEVKDF